MEPTQILKTCTLVKVQSYIRGGIRYQRKDVDPEHTTASGSSLATWETTREIDDPAEHRLAVLTRAKALNLVSGVCTRTEWGLLAPGKDGTNALADKIEEAREVVADFNRTAQRSRIEFYVIRAVVQNDNEEAAKAVASEIRALLRSMEGGIKALDPTAIRDAATRAAQMGQVLGTRARVEVSYAVKEARQAARQIAQRIKDEGEKGADFVASLKTQMIQEARAAFLDLDAPDESLEPTPAAPTRGALDFTKPDSMSAAPAAPDRKLDL